MSSKDGGPAFPTDSTIGAKTEHHGMSLRDYFAGQALAGMLATKTTWVAMADKDWSEVEVAGVAYNFADAMLAQREVKR